MNRMISRLADAEVDALHARWLGSQCPVCVEGGGGPECDGCVIEHDTLMRRAGDL